MQTASCRCRCRRAPPPEGRRCASPLYHHVLTCSPSCQDFSPNSFPHAPCTHRPLTQLCPFHRQHHSQAMPLTHHSPNPPPPSPNQPLPSVPTPSIPSIQPEALPYVSTKQHQTLSSSITNERHCRVLSAVPCPCLDVPAAINPLILPMHLLPVRLPLMLELASNAYRGGFGFLMRATSRTVRPPLLSPQAVLPACLPQCSTAACKPKHCTLFSHAGCTRMVLGRARLRPQSGCGERMCACERRRPAAAAAVAAASF